MEFELNVSFADPERTEYHTTCNQIELEQILKSYNTEFLIRLQRENPESTISLQWSKLAYLVDTQVYLAQAVTKISGRIQSVMRLYYTIDN